jgi:hypothetical protein
MLPVLALVVVALHQFSALGIKGQDLGESTWSVLRKCHALEPTRPCNASVDAHDQHASAPFLPVLSSSEARRDVSVTTNRPSAEVSGRDAMGAIDRVLAGTVGRAGEALFSLPSSRALLRIQSHETDVLAGEPSYSIRHSLALVNSDWSSMNFVEVHRKSMLGSHPTTWIESLSRFSYSPAIDVAMPVTEFLGLESGTASFRGGFHRPAMVSHFPGTRDVSGEGARP